LQVSEDGSLSVVKLQTQQLEVGTQTRPSGITIYDEESKQPYCIKMKAGAMISVAGKCEDITVNISSTEVIVTPSAPSESSSSSTPQTSAVGISTPPSSEAAPSALPSPNVEIPAYSELPAAEEPPAETSAIEQPAAMEPAPEKVSEPAPSEPAPEPPVVGEQSVNIIEGSITTTE
jgi:hypothetical protein